MGQKFTYESYREQLEKDRKLVPGAVEVIRKTVKLHGPRAVQEEISSMSPAPVDRGTYRRSFRFDDIDGGAIAYNFAPYAAVIEEGRRPGQRPPPVALILEWVKRKGIGRQYGPNQAGKRKVSTALTDNEARGIAFVIARAIGKRGVPAHHILEAAAVEIDRAVREAIDEYLSGRGA